MRRLVRVLATAAVVAAGGPSNAGAQPVGFEAELGAEGVAEQVAPECSFSDDRLTCAVYGIAPPEGAECSFGGTVAEIRFGARTKAQRGFVCVDEGFHDWEVLSPGRTWRRGGFECSHRWVGSGLGRVGRLECRNAAGHRFSVDGRGRVVVASSSQRSWLALGDSFASGEGIPGTVPGVSEQGRDCRRATGEGTDATAWSANAYRRVRKRFGFNRMSFVACTGAITDEIDAQIGEASGDARLPTWDLVTLGIGGNNIRFAEVLKGCLDISNAWDAFDATPGCDVSPERMRARVDMLMGKRDRERGEYAGKVTLPDVLDDVAAVVEPGGDVVVTGYPQIVEEVARWDRWRRNVLANCEGILSRDVGGLRGVTGYLNEQIARSVARANKLHRGDGVRFHFVDIANDPYEYSDEPNTRHALCAPVPWLSGRTSGITSGDWWEWNRSFHPKQVGHTNTGRVVAALVRDRVKFDDRPPAPEPESCGQVGFEENTDNVASNIEAQGVSCEDARALVEASNSPDTRATPDGEPFDLNGFTCTITTTEEGLPIARYSCTAGDATVTWERS
jgi:hypothetical protein